MAAFYPFNAAFPKSKILPYEGKEKIICEPLRKRIILVFLFKVFHFGISLIIMHNNMFENRLFWRSPWYLTIGEEDDTLQNLIGQSIELSKVPAFCLLELSDLSRLTPHTFRELGLEYEFSKMNLIISTIIHIYAKRMLKIWSFYGQLNLGLCEYFLLFRLYHFFFPQKNSCFSSQKCSGIIASEFQFCYMEYLMFC